MVESGTGTAIKVVLVDDHPVVRAGYRRLLELESDVRVVGEYGDVQSALSALEAPEDDAPDVVIVDLAMPQRNGLEMVKALRQRGLAPRILVFSMHDSSTVVAEALRLGAHGYVTKASAPDELIVAVRRVMQQSMPVLSSDLAVRRVLRASEEPPLTLKEVEVLRLLAAGQSVQAIGQALQLSPKTVSNYQTMLKAKLGAETAADLLRYARQRGFAV